MLFEKRTILLHGAKTVHLLVPHEIPQDITAVCSNRDHLLFSRGNGFEFLAKLFSLACLSRENEHIVLPLHFAHNNVFSAHFLPTQPQLTQIILINYCASQLSPKTILDAIHAPPQHTQIVTLNDDLPAKPRPPFWKTNRKLTVKTHGKNLLIYGNADIYTDFAYSCKRLAACGNDPSLNDDCIHAHFDMGYNTSKSEGIILELWNPPHPPCFTL